MFMPDRVLEALAGGAKTAKEVAEIIGIKPTYAGSVLSRLRRRGQARSNPVCGRKAPRMVLTWEITVQGTHRLTWVKQHQNGHGI